MIPDSPTSARPRRPPACLHAAGRRAARERAARWRAAHGRAVLGPLVGGLLSTGVAIGGDEISPLGIVERDDVAGALSVRAAWMRMPVEWRFVEPEDDVFNWASGFNAWSDEAIENGIRPTPVLSIGRMWASGFSTPASTPSHPPTDLSTTFDPAYGYSETYYDFVASFVTHYRDRLDRITIENEANTFVFWAGSMDDYWRVVVTAAKAVDDVAPAILVFDSGLGSGAWGAAVAQWMLESGDVPDADVLRFANDYYQHDVYAPLSWSSVHDLRFWLSQPFVQENNKRVDFTLATVPPFLDGLNFKFTQNSWVLPTLLDWIDRRMAQHGHAPLTKVNNEASNWPRGGPANEAMNLFRIVILGLAGGVEQTLWFPLSNEVTDTPRRGLYDENGEWTLQADAYVTLATEIGGDFRFADADTLGENVQRFRFQRIDESEPRLDALWWDDGGHGNGFELVSFPVPTDTDSLVIIGFDGSRSSQAVGDTATVAISAAPRLLAYVSTLLDAEVPADPTGRPALAARPNPFRGSVAISATVPVGADGHPFEVAVFDAAGRHVRALTSSLPAVTESTVTLDWDGRDDRGRRVSPGAYWVRLVAAGETVSRRVLVAP